ncbi:hypothetical protein EDD16DRAFT_594499 [Pisolithus croceorrhizus]|nr:hypothetical protein EDD16DRAFT_594499 [Pisolithus croceorrhizus]
MSIPVYASAPFNHAKADAILRTSDSVDFRIFRLLLSLASPFFETLFELPQPPEGKPEDTEMRDGLPVIPVSEDSKTLDAVLRFCYPYTLTEKPSLGHSKTILSKDGVKIEDAINFEDNVKMLEAAKKYSLDGAEKAIRTTLFTTINLETDPLRCFAIARQARMQEETVLSARYSLRTSLVPDWFKEIEMITSTDILALWAYHKRCGVAVQRLQLDFSWIEQHYNNPTAAPWIFGNPSRRQCGCPRSNIVKLFDRKHLVWWEEFMETTFQTLREEPCAQTVYDSVEQTIEKVRELKCRSCTPNVATVMHQFGDLFAKKVEEVISEVMSLISSPRRCDNVGRQVKFFSQ